jgi:hypothetical protein
MRSTLSIIAFLFLALGCQNIEDASLSGKDTFVKFYHGTYSYQGVEVEILPNGYAILGNMVVASDSVVAFIFETDKKGNQVKETHFFPGNTAKSFEAIVSNNEVSGYVVVADSIHTNPSANRVGDIEIYSAHLFKVDQNGTILKLLNFTDPSTDTSKVKIDYKGISLTITEDNEIIALGTYKEDLAKSEKPFIVSLDINLAPKWSEKYDLVDHNYINGKSIHYDDGSIIWATAILKPTGDFNDSYIAIPKVKEENTFENSSVMGEVTSQLFLAREIQPANSAAFGYGVVGTRGLTSGEKSNMFFIRVDKEGNFIASSERYFDNSLSTNDHEVTSEESQSEDVGESLTSTTDGGYVLAGSTQKGTDLRDAYLVKVDGFGNMEWSKTFGGVGDETSNCIREENDGSLVILGTNDLAGLSSLFLIKTDKDGELKK